MTKIPEWERLGNEIEDEINKRIARFQEICETYEQIIRDLTERLAQANAENEQADRLLRGRI